VSFGEVDRHEASAFRGPTTNLVNGVSRRQHVSAWLSRVLPLRHRYRLIKLSEIVALQTTIESADTSQTPLVKNVCRRVRESRMHGSKGGAGNALRHRASLRRDRQDLPGNHPVTAPVAHCRRSAIAT
jgi:hypothetical protein